MADLSTAFGGLRLPNPVIAASCEYTMTEPGILACIDAGAGAVVAKSINESPAAAKQLDIADYLLLDQDLHAVPWTSAHGTETLFNRSGLAQTTLEEWVAMLERCQRHASATGSAVIGSVTVASAEGAARLAAAMAEVVPAIEVNVGAPHGREAAAVRQITEAEGVAHYTRTVRAAIDCPLIVKLPGQAGDIVGMARAAAGNGADAVCLTGRFNGFVPNLDTWDPELGSWGAIGGPWALPISLYWISKCFGTVPALIGTNGARDGLDVARFLLSGAQAVEMASLLLSNGAAALARTISQLDAYLDQHGVTRLDEVIGAAVRRAKEYHEIDPIVPPVRPWLDN
ncbi:dihydroorotate dehydrogenase [Nonomuraea sp. NPDC050153]|uniref:dihydroorotate dehydrogenase n=1 Tax=Nonomuraea sp. NPDC050153 TaxID=3364359 RepID=UPI0037BBFE91